MKSVKLSLEISGQNYSVTDIINTQSSIVYIAINVDTNQKVLIKTSENVLGSAYLSNEFHILNSIKHENIMSAYELSQISSVYSECAIYEYIQGKHIDVALRSENEKFAFNIFKTLIEVVQYLASKKIFHCDLKPSNVMIEEGTKKLKLIDFGSATAENHSRGFTPAYKAPELTDQKIAPTIASELYSIGVMFYSILTGRMLADSIHVSKPTELNGTIHKNWDEIVMNLISADPNRRLAVLNKL